MRSLSCSWIWANVDPYVLPEPEEADEGDVRSGFGSPRGRAGICERPQACVGRAVRRAGRRFRQATRASRVRGVLHSARPRAVHGARQEVARSVHQRQGQRSAQVCVGRIGASGGAAPVKAEPETVENERPGSGGGSRQRLTNWRGSTSSEQSAPATFLHSGSDSGLEVVHGDSAGRQQPEDSLPPPLQSEAALSRAVR